MNALKVAVVILAVIVVIEAVAIAYLYQAKPSTTGNNTAVTPVQNQQPRIVSLAPSDTQILIALGLGKDIVGVDEYSYQLLKELNLTYLLPSNVTLLGQIYPPNISGILLLKPTAVVVEEGLTGSYVDQMKQVGLNVIVTNNDYATSFPQIESSIYNLGQYFNRTQQALELIAWMNNMVSNFSSPKANATNVTYLIWVNNDYTFYTAGGNVFINSIIQSAGGYNVFSSYSGYPKLTPSQLLLARPQVIIASEMFNSTFTLQTIEGFPDGSQIPAIKDGRVYVLGNLAVSLMNEPGPLSVYAVKLVNLILEGNAPHVINSTWVMENVKPELPVFS